MTDLTPSRADIRQQGERVRESLRSAHDQAASARCGPISPVSCPRSGCSWRAHGIPEKLTAARAREVERHIDEEHGTPTEGTEGATDDLERPDVDTEPPGALTGHQAGTESPDDLSARWARRAELGVLLSRMQRDVLLDAERTLLRAAVERELTDAEQAWAEVARLRKELAEHLRGEVAWPCSATLPGATSDD